ncbi:hypothetical protein KBB05_01870 [Patescibacteria group bacterium]|nr:hypothetical protein [Patescibacteria group bacterium]
MKSNVDKLLSTIKGTPTPVQVEPYDHAFSNFDYNHPLYASISDYEHTTILSALENADKMINID